MKFMRHYLFEDTETGEEFIVGADNLREAREIAVENFGENVEYQHRMTDYEAEASGLDEY